MRFRALDAWRGAGAILVAVFHYEAHYNQSAPALGPLIKYAFYYVDFFIVLSGFVIAYTYVKRLQLPGESRAFLLRRFGRLWPLNFVMVAAFVGVAWWGGHPYPATFWYRDEINPVLTSLLFLQGMGLHNRLVLDYVTWSVSVDFYVCIVFLLLAWGLPRLMPSIAAALVAVGAVVVFVFAPEYMATTYSFGFFRCLYGFFVGYFAYLYMRRWDDTVPRGTVAEAAAIFVVVGLILIGRDTALSMIGPLVWAGFIMIFALEGGMVSRVLRLSMFQHIGEVSYSIYLVHPLALRFFGAYVPALLSRQSGANWDVGQLIVQGGWLAIAQLTLLLLLYLLFAIAAAHVTYYLIEQPGRRFFNTLVARRRPVPAVAA